MRDDCDRYNRGDLSQSRLEVIRRLLDDYILPVLRDEEVDQIFMLDIHDMMDPIFKTKYPTFKEMWSYTRKVFDRCWVSKQIESNSQ